MSTRTISKTNLFHITSSLSTKFWQLLMVLYNLLPFGIFRSKSMNDAKEHSIALLAFLSVLVLPSLIIPMIAIYFSLKK